MSTEEQLLMLADEIHRLRVDLEDLRLSVRAPNQALDITSEPTFAGIFPGSTSSYLKNYRIAALANSGVAALVDSTVANGFLFISSPTDQTAALFLLKGSGHATAILVQDAVGQFTITATTAAKHNVYWSAGNARYELENKIGSARSYNLLFFGQ